MRVKGAAPEHALQIPDLFNALWYLGSFFPFLIGQLRVEFDIFKSDEYYNQIEKNLETSLKNDVNKLEKNFIHLFYIFKNFFDNLKRKEEYSGYIDFTKNNKDKYKIDVEIEKELEKRNGELEKEINLDNLKEKLASAVRSIKKRLYKVPRKIYEFESLKKSAENKNCFCHVTMYSL